MTAFFDALFAAGPMAGWLIGALAIMGGLYLYATDRLISRGRHTEQREHYEQRLAQQHAEHVAQTEELRRHMQELVKHISERLAKADEDRTYWRDTALDAMNALAASVGRADRG